MPATLGLFLGQLDAIGYANIRPQSTGLNEDPAPNHFPGLADALDGAPAQGEVHGRLSLADGTGILSDQVLRRHGTRNLEHPDEFLFAVDCVGFAVPQVMQCRFRIHAKPSPDAVRDQRVQPRAFVDFVEVGHGATREELAAVSALGGRTFDVIQQALHQIGCRTDVLESLLVLDADRVAPEFVGNPQSGDVHLALPMDLGVGQVGGLVRSGLELHSLPVQPSAYALRFVVADRLHRRPQRRLTQTLLVHACRVEQVIRNDCVVHSHAAFVEDPENRLAIQQFIGDGVAGKHGLVRKDEIGSRMHVRLLMIDGMTVHPALETGSKEFIGEVLAPERRVIYARLGETAVEIQHAHQARPLATPVGNGENRAFVVGQPRQQVLGVLPDRFGDDERGLPVDRTEDLQTALLAVDESMLLGVVVLVRSPHGAAEALDRRGQLRLHVALGRPAHAIGRKAQVSVGYEQDFLGHNPEFSQIPAEAAGRWCYHQVTLSLLRSRTTRDREQAAASFGIAFRTWPIGGSQARPQTAASRSTPQSTKRGKL